MLWESRPKTDDQQQQKIKIKTPTCQVDINGPEHMLNVYN